MYLERIVVHLRIDNQEREKHSSAIPKIRSDNKMISRTIVNFKRTPHNLVLEEVET